MMGNGSDQMDVSNSHGLTLVPRRRDASHRFSMRWRRLAATAMGLTATLSLAACSGGLPTDNGDNVNQAASVSEQQRSHLPQPSAHNPHPTFTGDAKDPSADSGKTHTPSQADVPEDNAIGGPRGLADGLVAVDAHRYAKQDRFIFASPSGNIVCQFSGTSPEDGCHLTEHPEWGAANRCPYPGVAPQSDTAIGFRHGPSAEPCHWVVQGHWPTEGNTLPYGHEVSFPLEGADADTMTCQSEREGVRCESAPHKHGFFVSDRSYRTW